MNRNAGLIALAVLGAVSFLATGLWPFFDAHSFYEEVAEYPPYNAHFLHDVGAFQIGLGATLLFALIWRTDAIVVAMLGAGTGAAFHVAAHIADNDLGGSDGQTIFLGVFAALLLGGGVLKLISGSRERGSRFR